MKMMLMMTSGHCIVWHEEMRWVELGIAQRGEKSDEVAFDSLHSIFCLFVCLLNSKCVAFILDC